MAAGNSCREPGTDDVGWCPACAEVTGADAAKTDRSPGIVALECAE